MVATSMVIDAREVTALDALVDFHSAQGPGRMSRTKIVQAAIREYLERHGYRTTWHGDRNHWEITLVGQDGALVARRWIGPDQLPVTRRPDRP